MGELSSPSRWAGVEQILTTARACTGSPVVIDLTDCIVIDPKPLADLAADDRNVVALHFVSRRPTYRLLFARSGVTSGCAVLHHLEEALQAKTFADASFGQGWRSP